ncbi:3-deoxy-D-manno-octulosonate 8-phosphate phosphatase (KDO 8-P phosphatase) [Lacinutrix venerupis]|uniref:KdsC family phosphatase n=1 Tax=Lacinutrix venerupis TaxID=1486034 RepID=UPI000EB0E710|nr:HAD-IIIA family hydrolase [Lacinutrix venerupis]RLJ68641.1 3-deoxy-D-manno-octulosonate 8-phosphate phosphatase (KDO 8-P phosphatase) [Lacinutrix venerupis]
MAYDKSYKEHLSNINTFIFDVDGVLTDGSLTITANGDMLRTMNVKDGYALKQALNKGYNLCIISGGINEGVKKRLENLGIKDVFLGAHNKIEQFNIYIKDKNIKSENVLYMGDDIPDIPVLELVGLATCPQDAVQEVKQLSKYISHKKGGKGCVRDVIEQVLKVNNDWNSYFDASL